MNRSRVVVALGIALLLGLVASTVVYKTVSRSTAMVTATRTANVVVAAGALPLGTRMDSTNLRVVAWPATSVLPGMFSKVEDCAGRALLTSVVENEPILDAKLAPKESGVGLPAAIPQGMRAMSVAVNEVIGVAGFVQPGTMVDVMVTGTPSASEGAGSTVTRTILENVPVIAAGQKIEQDKAGVPQAVTVVTLLVNPEDADKLAMATVAGRIQLALRNTVDTKKTEPPPVYQAAIFGGQAPAASVVKRPAIRVAAPPAAPPATLGVEIIRGGKREVETFPKP